MRFFEKKRGGIEVRRKGGKEIMSRRKGSKPRRITKRRKRKRKRRRRRINARMRE